MESEGNSWYNGLEVSLTKRLSRGLQFLASCTFSKTLYTDGADINSTSNGNALTLGDQPPQTEMGTGQFRSHSPIRFQHHVDTAQPASGCVASCSRRLVSSCNHNRSVWQRS